ncbi:MAG: SWIM zinc finger family protein [Microcoleus sp.]
MVEGNLFRSDKYSCSCESAQSNGGCCHHQNAAAQDA